MKKLLLFITLLTAFTLAACSDSNDANADETNKYKVSSGEITNTALLINLAVRAETTIEEFKSLDGVKVSEKDITAHKLDDQTIDGTTYPNVYQVKGKYAWDGKKYDFDWTISFNENNTTTAGHHLNFE